MDHVKLRLNACPHSPSVAPAKAGGFVKKSVVFFALSEHGQLQGYHQYRAEGKRILYDYEAYLSYSNDCSG